MINKWIANIVVIAILGVLLDMILPSGNLKSYTRFFVGLMSIIVILQPILRINHELPELEKHIWSQTMAMELESFNTQSQKIQADQESYVMELYRNRLEEHVITQVKTLTKDSNVGAEITLAKAQGQESYIIHRMDVTIGPTNLVEIEPIKINPNSDEEEKVYIHDSEREDLGSIKKHLSQIYEIEESKIFIKSGLKS